MSLDTLLARLEARTATPVTAAPMPSVTPEPLQNQACTPVTPVTDDAARMLQEDDIEFFNQRAGFLQFGCNLSCADAEAQALAELQVRQQARQNQTIN